MEQEVMIQSTSLYKRLLNYLIKFIYKAHTYILSLNDKFEYNFNDKQLHFLVIGLFGIALMFVLYPIAKWLASKNKTMILVWFYVFTLLISVTLIIEIGQAITGTGDMEFGDIVAGLLGFVIMSIAYMMFVGFIKIFKKK